MPVRALTIRALVLEGRDVPITDTVQDTTHGVSEGLKSQAFDVLELEVHAEDVRMHGRTA